MMHLSNERMDDEGTHTTTEGAPMTYNRMEAKPIAGEHCRFCGDASAPLVKTPCCQQWIGCDTALCRFEVAAVATMSTNAVRCAIPTLVIGTQALGKRVSTAVSAGRRKSTKPMRNIRSMCRDIEWRDGDKGQIPGKRIEPQRPLLDTLLLGSLRKTEVPVCVLVRHHG